MRVDLNRIASGQIANDQTSAAKKVGPSGNEPVGVAEDKATLSSDSVSISALATKALENPEVRQDKVDGLREQIQSKQYKIDHGKIADAIAEEHAKK